jgi:hypothetical protein
MAKIRNGFVSNSSSSSFICNVCNRISEGYDWNNSSGGIVQCEHGHFFCYDHALEKDDSFWDCLKNDGIFPEKYCPVCHGHGKVSLFSVYQFLKDAPNSVDMSENEFVKHYNKWDRYRYFDREDENE